MDLRAELRNVEAELALRKSKPPVAPKLSALPKPRAPHVVDRNREANRAWRRLHELAGKCSYLKCRGEHCPGGHK